MANLTDKQRAFVAAYLTHFNATQAAKDAGYQANDDNVFAVIGHENLRKPKIRELIEQHLREQAMTAEEVLMRLAEQARGSLADFLEVQPGGKIALVNLEKAQNAGLLHLIHKYEFKQGEGIKIELHNAQTALKLLGQAHQLFTEKTEHVGEITMRVVYADDGTDDQSPETTS